MNALRQTDLGEIVRRIVAAAQPRRIILFGPAIHGEAGRDDPPGFLVVVDDGLRRYPISQSIYKSLSGMRTSVDVVVATEADLRLHGDSPGSIFRPALRQGRELYRRPLTDPPTSAVARSAAPRNGTAAAVTADSRASGGPSARGLAWSTLIVMAGFVGSRVLGLLRETVVGAQFGTSRELDAYNAAFRIPDTLFLLMMGGALASAFIPVFASLLAKGETREAWRVANSVINASLVALVATAALAFIFAPWLVRHAVAPGFDAETSQLATNLTRLLLLSPIFIGLGGVAMGVLQSYHHFTLPSLAPVFYNICIIVGAVALAPSIGVYGLAFGVVVGAFLYLLLQIPGLTRRGYVFTPRIEWRNPSVREVARLILPRTLGQAAFQINFIVITNLASRLAVGNVAALNFAYNLLMLPIGVFAMSISSVIFPTLIKQVARGSYDEARATLSMALRVTLFLIVPSSVGLMLLRYPVISLLFQRGRFTADSTRLTAWALLFFAAGLAAYAVVELVTRAFYSMHDTRTPVAVGVATMFINLALAMSLMGRLHQGGLALGLTLATTVEMVVLVALLRRKLGGFDGTIWGSLQKAIMASIGLGALVFALDYVGGRYPLGTLTRSVWTLLTILAGAAAYLLLSLLLRSEELALAWRLLRRRTAHTAAAEDA